VAMSSAARTDPAVMKRDDPARDMEDLPPFRVAP
jgi:hypothetical protein